ncbi:MAG: hypothetical protein FWH11_01380 [Micrococcales bacterium]|nr:hypothetical protein [Micrococcales bacterium]
MRALKWGTAGLALVVALGFALGWFGRMVDVVAPDNVTEQHRAIIQDWQTMTTAAANACQAQTAGTNPASPTLVEDPAMAYAATFRSIAADYNRRQANVFEARVAGPAGYPDSVAVPSGDVDWCAVVVSLEVGR